MRDLLEREELNKLNIRHSIKGAPAAKLQDILLELTRERLNRLAGEYSVTGRSKMNKDALIEALYSRITDANEIRARMLKTRPEEMNLVKRLSRVDYVEDENLYPGQYLYLMSIGWLFSFYDKGELVYVIPEEIRKAYLLLSKQRVFMKEHNRLHTVLHYIAAAANLYGICPMDKVKEIFNGQQDIPLTEDELLGALIVSAGRPGSWYFFGKTRSFISNYFDSDSDDELEELIRRAAGKPYYIPEQEEYLRYSDDLYHEVTPQYNRLKAYVLRNLCKDEEFVDDLVDDIQLACSMEEPLNEILFEFDRRDIQLASKEQLEEVLALVVGVANHTRLWSNRGHTPSELGSGSPLKLSPSAKVGRNDPCPCGSGKKYKKCCL